MPRTGPPKTPLEVTDEESAQLARWVQRRRSSHPPVLRCRILLACEEGLDNKTVAKRVGCSQNTVSEWPARFLEAQLDRLTR
ncbi:helix-turn-helix domain-containing protein [Mycobacterium sp.]|uniref:helix-turn-helix domain-containing protein n=1 Tax=Mycobacterium sp. TaxID=1785 RepID=UPI003A851EA4